MVTPVKIKPATRSMDLSTDTAPALTEPVKFKTKIYLDSCKKCIDGSVELSWDPMAKSNILNCLVCGWTVVGQELRQ